MEKVGQKSESSLWHSGNHCFYERREVWNKGIIVQIYCSNFHAWHKTFVEIKWSYITVEYIISINHNKKTVMQKIIDSKNCLNPFALNALFLQPLNTSESHTLFCCFQEVKKKRSKWVEPNTLLGPWQTSMMGLYCLHIRKKIFIMNVL